MEWWLILAPLIGGTVGGSLVAGGFTVYTTMKAHQREHHQWLRNQKQKCYLAFAVSALRIDSQTKGQLGKLTEWLERSVEGGFPGTEWEVNAQLDADMLAALSGVAIIAPGHVVRAATEAQDAGFSLLRENERRTEQVREVRDVAALAGRDVSKPEDAPGNSESTDPYDRLAEATVEFIRQARIDLGTWVEGDELDKGVRLADLRAQNGS